MTQYFVVTHMYMYAPIKSFYVYENTPSPRQYSASGLIEFYLKCIVIPQIYLKIRFVVNFLINLWKDSIYLSYKDLSLELTGVI